MKRFAPAQVLVEEGCLTSALAVVVLIASLISLLVVVI